MRINRDSDHFLLIQRLLKKLALSLFVTFVTFFLIAPLSTYAAEVKQAGQKGALEQDKISLDLKNVEIVELLRIISLKTGKTIVPSKGISGRITIYLSNVVFDDVLDIILLTQDLASYKKGNVYYVMTAAEYKKIYGKDYIDQRNLEMVKLTYAKPATIFNALGQLKSDVGKIVVDETSGTVILIDTPEKLKLLKETITELDQPLGTSVFNLNYAKAADAKTQLNAAITPGTGEVIIDERSQKAIVSDLPKKMEKIERLVRELDEESRQVYVEADVIELTLSKEFQRGIDWQEIMKAAVNNGITFTGYFPITLTNYQQILVNTTTSGNHILIKFLETYGKTNVISQPRIAIVNNEEANLMVGERDAYITQTQSQATSTTVTSESVEFVDVGVKLKIVPRIGADGFITMKLKPEVSSVKQTLTTALGSLVPIVQTSQSETTVKVKDGTMIVLAGMTKTEETDDIVGVPIISKIPFLGALFSNRDKSITKTEVIIFITPHIIRGDMDLKGKKITQFIPNEYLPENLQKKVARDEALEEATMDLPSGEKKSDSHKSDSHFLLQDNANDYYQKGLRAQADANPKDAKEFFLKAIQLDNKLAPAYNNLGIIYEQEGKPREAEAMYLKAISVNPDYAAAYANLALFNEGKGDSAKALDYWRKRVSYGDPDDDWTKEALQRVKEFEKWQEEKSQK
ncbi:MAG: secretin N-terminal domain-containing protein [Candidatus Omnitrophota bacterium]|nr:secretin N-terminal domain-containing protein [Candidatus Omnitrophota bacterium]